MKAQARPMLPSILVDATEHLSNVDPIMGRLISQIGSCSVYRRSRSHFDVLASSIVGQQLSAKAAGTIRARLCGIFGHPRPFRPIDFVNADRASLRSAGLSGAKARYVTHLAEGIISSRLCFRSLREAEDEVVIKTLSELPGIGRWTAEMFLIFGMRRSDIFSMADAGLRRAVQVLYGNGRQLSDNRIHRISTRWAPYRSVASWYLWRSLD
jgi:DNA-3-methyladenine glycosylase II